MRLSRSRAGLLLVYSFVVLGLSACGGDDDNSQKKSLTHLVELAEAREDRLSYRAQRSGSLRALRTVKLFNQEEGRVIQVNVRQGDSVRKGKSLVKLDDRLLRAQLDKAIASRRLAEQDVKRLQQLKAKQLIAEEALNRATTTLEIARAEMRLLQTRISYFNIKAPFAGKIAERKVEPGDVAPKHTHLLTIIDPSKLVTDVQVSELALPYMKVGDNAEVRIDALGQNIFSGKVVRIYPTVDPATRLGRIEVALSPVPKDARAGQFSRVTLSTAKQKRLVVPFSALRRDAVGEYVFLYDDEAGTVSRRAIKSGLRLADKVEIREGLSAGQRVVAKGFIGLTDGKKVKVVEKEMPEKETTDKETPGASPSKSTPEAEEAKDA
jgi:membrane fusion protein, multidrug efflux system